MFQVKHEWLFPVQLNRSPQYYIMHDKPRMITYTGTHFEMGEYLFHPILIVYKQTINGWCKRVVLNKIHALQSQEVSHKEPILSRSHATTYSSVCVSSY